MTFNAMPLLNLLKEMVFRLTWMLDRRRVEVFINFIFFFFSEFPQQTKSCVASAYFSAWSKLSDQHTECCSVQIQVDISHQNHCTVHHSFSLHCVTLSIYVLMGYMSMLDSRDHGESVISQYNILNFTAVSFYVVLCFL